MRRLLTRLAAAALLAMAPLAVVGPAQALSCAGPGWIHQPDARIPHVVVGRIADAQDQRLSIEVPENWRGRRVPGHVWVRADEDMVGWYARSDRRGDVPDGFSTRRPYVLPTDADLTVGVCSYWPLARSVRQPLASDEPRLPLPRAEAQQEPPAAGQVREAAPDPVRAVEPAERELPATATIAATTIAAAGLVAVVGAGGWWWRRRRRGAA